MKHDMLETKKGRDKMNVALTDYEKKAYDNGYDSGYGSGYDNGRDSVYALLRALKERLLAAGHPLLWLVVLDFLLLFSQHLQNNLLVYHNALYFSCKDTKLVCKIR